MWVPRWLLITLGIILGSGALLKGCVGDAWSHSWYDASCCSNQDCAPISDDEVTEVPAPDGSTLGFQLKTRNEFIPFKETKQGKDGDFHLCVNQYNGSRICFYRKFNGV